MNKEEFINYLKSINVILTEEQITKFDIYCDYLIEYNEHTNLTAIKTPNEVYLKHFVDSILLTKYYSFLGEEKVLDLGTGAGFPGVVLKILYPKLYLTLLDSNNKKILFLKSLLEKLSINDVELVNDRVENYVKTNRENFDLVTSRAVANLNTLSELSIPLVKVGGYFIPMKGNGEQELSNALNAIKLLGGEVIYTYNYLLPIENSGRMIFIIKHTIKTETLYPRTYDKIIKKPL